MRDTRSDRAYTSVWFILLLCGSMLLSTAVTTCSAHAQDLPPLPAITEACAPELTTGRRAEISVGGAAGIWFAMPVARCLTSNLEALPLYAERVAQLQLRIEAGGALTLILREEVTLAERQAESAAQGLEHAIRIAREAEEDRDRWYRQPLLLIGLGVVLVIALEVTIVLLLHELE